MRPQDPKGYYKALGVPPSVSAEELRRAFRALAKTCHPDRNPEPGAVAQFRLLVEAFTVLSDPQGRALYDGRPYDAAKERARAAREAHARRASGTHQDEGPPDQPVQCSVCARPTAQPRRATYWTVASFGISWRKPTEGVYCAACAAGVALRCSAVTATLGWWGGLGLLWTPLAIWRNARGGQRQEGSDAELLWRNAQAFRAQGKLTVAHALARQVASMKSPNALDASDMLAELHREGVPRDTPPLVDPWRPRTANIALQIALGFAAPMASAVAIYFYGPPTGAIATTAYAQALAPMLPTPPAIPSIRRSVAAPPPGAGEVLRAVTHREIPTCARPPADGDLIEGQVSQDRLGHHLDITNGYEGATILKLRDPTTDRVRAAFYFSKGGHAVVGPIPDGAYRIQYAIGPALAEDCRSFTSIDRAAEFPETETLRREARDGALITQTLSLTLYAVPNGNLRADTIAPTRFLSD